MKNIIRHVSRLPLALALAAVGLAGCAIEEQSAPGMIGPSEFALALTTSVSPEIILRNGTAQATITVTARNESGAPAVGRRILVSATGPNTTVLSATEIVTGADGRGSVTITAPASASVGDLINVNLLPVDLSGNPAQLQRTIQIGVTPSNTVAPTAAFTFSPASPGVNEQVTFNASSSTDENVACGTSCTYAWNFGDGNTGTGMIVSKAYSASGNRSVTLTVTDAAGVASLPNTQTVAVAPPSPPVVGTVAVSPTPVRPGVTTNFDAGGATVGAGATITEYTWSWGDGTSDTVTSGPQAQHSFSAVGTYTVRTTVRDSLGRTATTTTSVAVTTS